MLRLSLVPLILLLSQALCAGAEPKPNVLFIAADDLRCDLACYGHEIVQTPNLDKLASMGTRFDRAYCAQALCNPSRSSLMTGLRPNTLRLFNLEKHFRDEVPDVVTLPELFKQNGYHTENIGKIFHNWRTEIEGDPQSWSVPAVMHFASHRDDLPQVDGDLPPNLAQAIRCECRDVPDHAYYDGRIAGLAVEAIERRARSDAPFFLAVGFWKPHLPFNAPKKYWDLYRPEDIPCSPVPQWPTNAPRIAWHNSQELLGKKDPPQLTEADTRELRHGYLAGISYLDAQVGRLLEALETHGLTDSTIIVFWSDHGFQLGDHTLWCKTSNFELDARVPMIIAPPKSIIVECRKDTSAIVELLDLYPTIADLAGVAPPKTLEGVSLVPLIDGTRGQVKDAALTQHPRPSYYGDDMKAMGYSIRTNRYRYTQWHDANTGALVASELYDHRADPNESANVYDDPAHASALSGLIEQLNRLAPDHFRKRSLGE